MQYLADRLIGGDAAGSDQRGRRAIALAEDAQAGPQPILDRLDDSLLERGAQIGDILVGQWRDLLRFEPQRSLQSRQREVGFGPAVHWPRQFEAYRVAAQRLLLDLRAARITKAEQLRGLVERLADRVVHGRSDARIVADAEHCDDLSVA